MSSPLSTFALARRNIGRRPWRSFCLVTAVVLFSFVLFTGTVLSFSLSRGARSAADRLGADVMVVPAGFDPHIDSVILAGKPSMFFLPHDILDRLKTIEGIERMSPQTFLATVRASCCSYPLQIIGIDEETDFLVRPWLSGTMDRPLRDGELIVGYRVSGEAGEKLHFFGLDLPIASRLDQTGMGFDAMVFVTRKTAADLAKAAENIFQHPLSKDGSLISTVMLRLRPGVDSTAVAREINRKMSDDDVYALFSKKFVSAIGSSLALVSWMIRGATVLIWALAVLVIALLFALTVNERRSEMGVLRALGASRRRILSLYGAEALLISLYGAALGVALGAAAAAAALPAVAGTLKLPFLTPSWPVLFTLAGMALAASVLTGAASAMLPALKAVKSDISLTMKGD
ncbi:MAG: FtsX-like permease family protein [Pyramidobacter sp.]|nr:FtsX-like permease family protein [Pyramidobacter sp.]